MIVGCCHRVLVYPSRQSFRIRLKLAGRDPALSMPTNEHTKATINKKWIHYCRWSVDFLTWRIDSTCVGSDWIICWRAYLAIDLHMLFICTSLVVQKITTALYLYLPPWSRAPFACQYLHLAVVFLEEGHIAREVHWMHHSGYCSVTSNCYITLGCCILTTGIS